MTVTGLTDAPTYQDFMAINGFALFLLYAAIATLVGFACCLYEPDAMCRAAPGTDNGDEMSSSKE
jgi:hypothetical protein